MGPPSKRPRAEGSGSFSSSGRGRGSAPPVRRFTSFNEASSASSSRSSFGSPSRGGGAGGRRGAGRNASSDRDGGSGRPSHSPQGSEVFARGRGGSRGRGSSFSGSHPPRDLAGGLQKGVSEAMRDAYKPQVIAPSSSSTHCEAENRPSNATVASPSAGPTIRHSVVVILEHCGLHLGRSEGHLVDAYERARTTEIHNASLLWARPDIVHQCLLALFDSDLAYRHLLKVYMHLVPSGKVVEVSPTLRPPRTYARFKGLMVSLLREGQVLARTKRDEQQSHNHQEYRRAAPATGGALLRVLPGSIAPILPHGAPCVGLCNDVGQPVTTPIAEASAAVASPVDDDAFQGGLKGIFGFYCISCSEEGITVRPEGERRRLAAESAALTRPKHLQRRSPSGEEAEDEPMAEEPLRMSQLQDEGDDPQGSGVVSAPSSAAMMRSVDYVTRTISPSAYPLSAHVMCARLCEGFGYVLKLSA